MKPSDEERKRLLKDRQALLLRVDGIEEYLEMPRTSEMRAWARENGYCDKIKDNDK